MAGDAQTVEFTYEDRVLIENLTRALNNFADVFGTNAGKISSGGKEIGEAVQQMVRTTQDLSIIADSNNRAASMMLSASENNLNAAARMDNRY